MDFNELQPHGGKIFLATTPGLASIFVGDLGGLPKFRKMVKRWDTNTNYLEWGLPDSKLGQPLKEITVWHNVKDLPDFEDQGNGFVYAIDVSKIKDKLVPFDQNPDPREWVYTGGSLPIKEKIPHSAAVKVIYDPSLEKKFGPGRVKFAALEMRKGQPYHAGIEGDLRHPGKYTKQLYADYRYLGNSGYPRIKEGKQWGGWDEESLKVYAAKIVDALRSQGYAFEQPDENHPAYNTSYWQLYRVSVPYMKSQGNAVTESSAPETKQAAKWPVDPKSKIDDWYRDEVDYDFPSLSQTMGKVTDTGKEQKPVSSKLLSELKRRGLVIPPNIS